MRWVAGKANSVLPLSVQQQSLSADPDVGTLHGAGEHSNMQQPLAVRLNQYRHSFPRTTKAQPSKVDVA